MLEFYAIDGKWTTLQKAAESKMFSTLATWANIVKECCYALFYIHSMNYVNCDIKSDNIVLRNGFGDAVETYSAVIIDFGEMKELRLKFYKLSLREQEKYGKYPCHIAPEVVRGRECHSAASDVFSLGPVISLICHYNSYEDLTKIAVQVDSWNVI